MKISQMTTDQAAECMVRLSQPVANIMDDDNLRPVLEQLGKGKNKPVVKLIAEMLPKLVPLAMRDHRQDMYEIVGALTEKPADEIGKMKFIWTLHELKESLDKDLIDFFKSSGTATQKAGGE